MATVNLAIGQVTPPVGVNLFVAISIKIKKRSGSYSAGDLKGSCANDRSLRCSSSDRYIHPDHLHFPSESSCKRSSYTGDQSSASSDTASKEAGDGNNSFDTIADYSDLDWPEMTWNFACSTTETSTC